MIKRIVTRQSGVSLCAAVADYLEPLVVQTPSGAKALDHVLVVVPTAEAGRRLRAELAHRLGALVPPRIAEPRRLLAPPESSGAPQVATAAEVRAVFAKTILEANDDEFVTLLPPASRPSRVSSGPGVAESPAALFERAIGAVSPLVRALDALEDAALGPADVFARLSSPLPSDPVPPPSETDRWRDFAALYARVEERLRASGVVPPLEAIRAAVASGPSIPDEVKLVIIPAPLDAPPAFYAAMSALPGAVETVILSSPPPQGFSVDESFDEWGRARFDADSPWMRPGAVVMPVRNEDIHRTPDARIEAEDAAREFFAGSGDAAFGMLDSGLLPALEAAFLALGVAVRDPALRPLRETALGATVRGASAMTRLDPSAADGAAFLRLPDVRSALAATGVDVGVGLAALDATLRRHLPRRWSDLLAFAERDDSKPLLGLIKAADDLRAAPTGEVSRGSAGHLFSILSRIFRGRSLSGDDPFDRAFASAAEAVRSAARDAETPLVSSLLSEQERSILLRSLLDEAHYGADEDQAAVPMLGWLELPWCVEKRLILAGFDEKCVPSAPLQDSFLPDSLRRSLGLQCADSRLARDMALFLGMLSCRAAGDVSIFTAKTTTSGDERVPSRLLACCGDESLPGRVMALFGEPPARPRRGPGEVPESWRLDLPIPSSDTPPRVSVSRFKTYLASPLQYYLENVVGDPELDGTIPHEIPANDFGTLCHAALEDFASEQSIRNSENESDIADYLISRIDTRFEQTWSASPSTLLPVAMRLQRDAARERMRTFAKIQSELSKEGWIIVAAETRLSAEIGGCIIRGQADRIDRHAETGEIRVIDYKTWASASSAWHKPFGKNPSPGLLPEPEAEKLSFNNGKNRWWWHDLQLPLYALMYSPESPAERISAAYLVLGDTEGESGFVGAVPGVSHPTPPPPFLPEALESAHATALEVCRRISAGLFAEPGKLGEVWETLIPGSRPERGIRAEWLADQASRAEAFARRIES